MAAWPFILCMEEEDGNPAQGQACFESTMNTTALSWSTVDACLKDEYDLVQKSTYIYFFQFDIIAASYSCFDAVVRSEAYVADWRARLNPNIGANMMGALCDSLGIDGTFYPKNYFVNLKEFPSENLAITEEFERRNDRPPANWQNLGAVTLGISYDENSGQVLCLNPNTPKLWQPRSPSLQVHLPHVPSVRLLQCPLPPFSNNRSTN
jgi:hypothetical protein